MSWSDGFVIEYVHKGNKGKRISCRDCSNYVASDRSCRKKPVYLPEIGYDLWKTCNSFKLSKSTNFYEEKLERINKLKPEKKKKQKQPQFIRKNTDESAQIVVKCKLNPEQENTRKKLIRKGTLVWGNDINDVGEVIDYNMPIISIRYDGEIIKKYNIYLAVKKGILRPL